MFRNYLTYKNIYSPTTNTDGLSFEETVFWLNNDGLIIRQETKKGLIDPRKVKVINLSLYTYDPNIRIEVPIK